MKEEILIGLGALVLSVLTYFAGVKRTERKFRQTERQDRIKWVIDKYLQLRVGNTTGGLDCLQKAGIATLFTNDEIKETIEQICKHGEGHPFGKYADALFAEDLKMLFEYSVKNNIKFSRTPVEEIIENYKSA